MIPGVNPRQVQQMMRQMGMSQEEMNATQVIIKTANKTYTFNNPSVQKITMQGQATFQLSGEYIEEGAQLNLNISEDDIKTVCEQAGVSEAQAKEALEKSSGDIAEAIVNLS